jgi:DNA polymerase V
MEEPVSISNLRAAHRTTGYPSPAEDFAEERLVLDSLIVRRPEATFYMVMGSESLCDDGVHMGDWLVIDRAEPPMDGCLVIVAADGQLLARRYTPTATGFLLTADAPGVEPIESGADGDIAIWGVVTYIVHRVKR